MRHTLTLAAEVMGGAMIAGCTVYLALIAGRCVNLWRLRRQIEREVRSMVLAHRMRERELAAVIRMTERGR